MLRIWRGSLREPTAAGVQQVWERLEWRHTLAESSGWGQECLERGVSGSGPGIVGC